MTKNADLMQPQYIFETSWEVCNRVGGIYAVLSTRAASMQAAHPDKVIFFGPDLGESSDRFFREDKRLLKGKITGCRVGRWLIPSEPIAVLLPWQQMFAQKDEIYGWAWEKFGVQSHAAYGDYDDSCLFAYAAAQKMEELYLALKSPNTVAHCNEWQTAFTLFYLHEHFPQIGTLFTTHATGIGRSIAGNGKPLYDYFTGYHGNQMAEELNMVSKHSVERQAAHHADCFTTVSDLTARECTQLLEKTPDIVTPNGFEPTFVPKGKAFPQAREQARKALRKYAEESLGYAPKEDSVMLCIAGRQEWKNKGIDVYLDAMHELGNRLADDEREVLAFVMIPYLEQTTRQIGHVRVIFVPYYLPIETTALAGLSYYQLLIGMDLTIFPSYYEPWGYTPLESIAFHVPTITTTLAGFGVWAMEAERNMKQQPVCVIERNDSNYHEVVGDVAEKILEFMRLDKKTQEQLRKVAATLAEKANWKHFFAYYREAYEIAMKKAADRK